MTELTLEALAIGPENQLCENQYAGRKPTVTNLVICNTEISEASGSPPTMIVNKIWAVVEEVIGLEQGRHY